MHFDVKEIFNAYLAGVDRLIARRPNGPVVGIDIDTSAVKAAVISAAGGNLELTAWAIERIEGGDVKEALTKVLTRVKFSNEVPVTAVSGKGTLIRYIDLPRMPIEDLRRSFVYDMDKYFPFDPQSIYTDCFILERKTKDKRMPVLVAAVKKEMVDDRIGLFKEAGVELAQVTINSIAIANAFERLGPPLLAGGNAKAVLDVGGSVCNLLVIKDMSPWFTRDIFVGSQEIITQIANVLGVDTAAAEKLKCDPGERAAEVVSSCEAAVSNLVSEIRLSLDYFMTEKNVQIDEFFLLGGGSLLKGIESVFEKNLGIPVKTWDPLANIHLGPAIAASDIRAFSSQMGVAVGLGLSAVGQG